MAPRRREYLSETCGSNLGMNCLQSPEGRAGFSVFSRGSMPLNGFHESSPASGSAWHRLKLTPTRISSERLVFRTGLHRYPRQHSPVRVTKGSFGSRIEKVWGNGGEG